MTGKQLMKKFVDWSEMNKVKEVILSVSEQVGSFDKIAKRLGMEKNDRDWETHTVPIVD